MTLKYTRQNHVADHDKFYKSISDAKILKLCKQSINFVFIRVVIFVHQTDCI